VARGERSEAKRSSFVRVQSTVSSCFSTFCDCRTSFSSSVYTTCIYIVSTTETKPSFCPFIVPSVLCTMTSSKAFRSGIYLWYALCILYFVSRSRDLCCMIPGPYCTVTVLYSTLFLNVVAFVFDVYLPLLSNVYLSRTALHCTVLSHCTVTLHCTALSYCTFTLHFHTALSHCAFTQRKASKQRWLLKMAFFFTKYAIVIIQAKKGIRYDTVAEEYRNAVPVR